MTSFGAKSHGAWKYDLSSGTTTLSSADAEAMTTSAITMPDVPRNVNHRHGSDSLQPGCRDSIWKDRRCAACLARPPSVHRRRARRSPQERPGDLIFRMSVRRKGQLRESIAPAGQCDGPPGAYPRRRRAQYGRRCARVRCRSPAPDASAICRIPLELMPSCATLRVKSMISLGSPHQAIAGGPEQDGHHLGPDDADDDRDGRRAADQRRRL